MPPEPDIDALLDEGEKGSADIDSLLAEAEKHAAPATPAVEVPANARPTKLPAEGSATRGLYGAVEPQWFEKLGMRQAENPDDYLKQISSTPGAKYFADRLNNYGGDNGASAIAKDFAATTAAGMAGAPGGIGTALATGALSGATTRAADDPNASGEDIVKSGVGGGLLGGALHGAAEGLGSVAKNAKTAANEYLTHIFMSPAQRAAFKAVKGSDALPELGQSAQEAGLFKPRGLTDYLLPRNARRVAENAEAKLGTAGPAIGKFEDKYVNNATSEVPVNDIADNLRSKAGSARDLWDTQNEPDARTMEALANRIDRPTSEQVEGLSTQYPGLRVAPPRKPMPALPPKPALEGEQLGFVPDRTPAAPMLRPEPQQQALPLRDSPEQMMNELAPQEQTQMPFPGAAIPPRRPALPKQMTIAQNQPYESAAWKGPKPQLPPPPTPPQQLDFGPQQMSLAEVPPRPGMKPEPWQPGQGPQGDQLDLGVNDIQHTPLEASANIRRETVPLAESVANRRDLGNRIDWAKKRGDQSTYGEEAARKYVWGQLKDKNANAFEQEVAKGNIPPEEMAGYKKNMKDFSTAATAFDPAMKMAERQGQVGLGLGDLMAGATVGGGPMGGLAALASKGSRGMGAATAASASNMLSKAADFVGKAAGVGSRMAPLDQPVNKPADVQKHDVEQQNKQKQQVNDDLKKSLFQRALGKFGL